MAVGFEKATGVKVAVVQKATGEMLAQVKAERANAKGDVWWAGPADSYLQAAEEGLLETYRSPALAELHDWARGCRDLLRCHWPNIWYGSIGVGTVEPDVKVSWSFADYRRGIDTVLDAATRQ